MIFISTQLALVLEVSTRPGGVDVVCNRRLSAVGVYWLGVVGVYWLGVVGVCWLGVVGVYGFSVLSLYWFVVVGVLVWCGKCIGLV